MATSVSDWKDDIRKRLIACFESDPDTLVRILFYLDEEEKFYKDASELPPVWKSLRSAMISEMVFKKYAERLAEDTRIAEKNERFQDTMRLVYDEMMEESEETLPEDEHQGFTMIDSKKYSITRTSAFAGLAKAWTSIPRETQLDILNSLPNFFKRQLASSVDEVVGMFSKRAGTVVMVALAGVYLSWEAISNVYRCWKGEISGKRCAKNIVDGTFTISAGVSGGMGGALIGACAGPFGALAGGIIGGVISSTIVGMLCDRMTQWLFGIPKDEALENAYRFLGVEMTASNHEINNAFHRLCLKYHPDKSGGNTEEFLMLQLNMTVIKIVRGELISQKPVTRSLTEH